MVKRRTPVTPEEVARRELALELKYGGKEELKAKRREWQAKSRLNYRGMGGFRSLSPERLHEITSAGGKARHQKYEKQNNTTTEETSGHSF